MEYKDKLDAFRSSCRVYAQEKRKLNDLKNESEDPVRKQYLQYMQEDIDFVEKTMDEIEKKCGPNARVLIWELYVENKTQMTVANSYHLTRRELQYSVNKWMHIVLDE